MTDTTLRTQKQFAEIIEDFVKAYVENQVNIRIPVKVTNTKNYNGFMVVDCECMIKELGDIKGALTGVEENFLRFQSVPVYYPATADDVYMSMPVKKGCLGDIVFYDKNMDEYKFSNGVDKVSRSSEQRYHDLSDALFIPGPRPFDRQLEGYDEDNTVIKNNEMSIVMHPDGKVEIKGATEEMVSVLSSALSNISNGLGNVANAAPLVDIVTGNVFPAAKTAILLDKTNLDANITKLDTLKV